MRGQMTSYRFAEDIEVICILLRDDDNLGFLLLRHKVVLDSARNIGVTRQLVPPRTRGSVSHALVATEGPRSLDP